VVYYRSLLAWGGVEVMRGCHSFGDYKILGIRRGGAAGIII